MGVVKLGTILVEQKEKVGVANGLDLPLIGVSNKEGLVFSKQKRLSNLSKYKLIKRGWFAYNPMRINVGSIGLADADSKTGIISPDYVVFSCTDEILPEYFMFFIKSQYGLDQISRHTGGSVRERLYFRNLAQMEIQLPSVEIQQTLVGQLSRRLSDLNKVNEILTPLAYHDLDDLKGEIINQAIMGHLTADWRHQNPPVESGSALISRLIAKKQDLVEAKEIRKERPYPDLEPEFVVDLPSSWKLSHLGRVSRQITDGTHYTPNYIEGGVRFLSVKDISSGKIDLSDTKFISEPEHRELIKRCNPQPKDILFCRIGTLGVPVVIDIKEPFSIFVSVGLIKLFKEDVSPEFIRLVLDSPYLWNQYQKVKAGGSHTNKLNLRDIPHLLIPIPPKEEQLVIVERAEKLLGYCSSLRAQLNNCDDQVNQLAQSCLKEVFSSKED